MRTFSSIYTFNASRFGLRRATCITNGAQSDGGGGGKKSIKDTALDVLRGSESVRATDWVDGTVARGFSKGAVWRVVSQLIRDRAQHGIELVPDESGAAHGKYCLRGGEPQTPSRKILHEEINKFAAQILKEQPDGEFIKLANWIADTMERVASQFPGASCTREKVHAAIYNRFIAEDADEKVERGDRGMYRRKPDAPDDAPLADQEPEEQHKREANFYKPFAAYLRDVLLECDGAKRVGGENGIMFGRRWENPDVVGIAINREDANVDYMEFVSAEIKIAKHLGGLMEGFGQASAYLRFSHKVYLVIPKETGYEPRLTDLCHSAGIGLVTLDPDMDPDSPLEEMFTLLTRARKQEPSLPELDKHLETLREKGGERNGKGLAKYGIKEGGEE